MNIVHKKICERVLATKFYNFETFSNIDQFSKSFYWHTNMPSSKCAA